MKIGLRFSFLFLLFGLFFGIRNVNAAAYLNSFGTWRLSNNVWVQYDFVSGAIWLSSGSSIRINPHVYAGNWGYTYNFEATFCFTGNVSFSLRDDIEPTLNTRLVSSTNTNESCTMPGNLYGKKYILEFSVKNTNELHKDSSQFDFYLDFIVSTSDGTSWRGQLLNLNFIDKSNPASEINDKLDEIQGMDISDEDKELPDDSSFQDYSDVEGDLLEYVQEADTSSLDIAIDVDSSNFVWDTLTDLIQSHSLVFSTVIAILSIGIIKLALGR